MGVPQGSGIAPMLVNIMVHDVDTAVKGKAVLTMYADDLAIWMHGDLHQTFPHNQPECEAQHEAFPGSCGQFYDCLLYTSPSPRDRLVSRMPSSA